MKAELSPPSRRVDDENHEGSLAMSWPCRNDRVAEAIEIEEWEIEIHPRPELIGALLESARTKRLTLLVAPAGSGKSVALGGLSKACLENRYAMHSITCCGEDANPDRFFAKLAGALGENGGNEKRILLLDDYQVCDTPHNNATLQHLLKVSAGRLHIVLASRRLPGLEVSALRMRRSLGEFSRKDLAARPGEVPRFIGLAPEDICDEQVCEILDYCEGWLPALQFMAQGAEHVAGREKGGKNVRAMIEAADHHMDGYLEEEIFRALPTDLQEFLGVFAPFETIHKELVEAVFPGCSAAALLWELIARDLFVVASGHHNEWVRLHPMFRRFLSRQARISREAGNRNLFAAAQWYWAKGDWRHAVNYAIDAGETETAELWLRACCEHVIADLGAVSEFYAACERLIDVHPCKVDLVLWMVWTAAFSMWWADAARLLSRHASKLTGPEAEPQKLALVRTLITFCSQKFPSVIELGNAWWDGAGEAASFDRATMAAMLAVSYKIQLDLKKAKIWCERARSEIARSSSAYGKVWIGTSTSLILLAEARPLEACALIEDTVSWADVPQNWRMNIEPLLSIVYYEMNRLDDAQRVLDTFIEIEHGCNSLEMTFNLAMTAALLEFNKSGLARTMKLIDAWSSRLEKYYGHEAILKCHLLQRDILSRVPLQERNSGECPDKMIDVSAQSQWRADDREWLQIIIARENLIAGQVKEAIVSLKHVLPSTLNDGRLAMWAHASLINAAAQRARGNVKSAERLLIECLRKVAPLGVRRLVLDQARMLRPFGPFLRGYFGSIEKSASDLADLIGRLLQVMGIAPEPGCKEERSTVEALTRQESRVLGLLAEGLTNAEIGSRLILTEGTVKWHLYNLFQKLDVSSRMAAVRQGRILGLID